MLSNKYVKSLLSIGYTFQFKGQYCFIIKLYHNRFEYGTMERPNGNYMYFNYFQKTPHFRSKFKNIVQKSLSLVRYGTVRVLRKFERITVVKN